MRTMTIDTFDRLPIDKPRLMKKGEMYRKESNVELRKGMIVTYYVIDEITERGYIESHQLVKLT